MTVPEKAWLERLKEHGYYAVSFELRGGRPTNLIQLREWMSTDRPRHTGWSPFWWPTRPEIAPRTIDQATYECVHAGSNMTGRVERWRASTEGIFTIVRDYDSDREFEPGLFLELTLPVWRVGELLLYAGRMALRFEAETIDFMLRYEGLAGRTLSTRASANRILLEEYTTHGDKYEKRVELKAADVDSGIVEMTDELVRGLYAMFQFELPAALCEEEIGRMRTGRF